MAHKKGVGSSKNGRESESKRLGIKLFGGERCKAGNIICRQRGTSHHPGENVGIGKDHTIYALIDGIVVFRKRKNDRSYISVKRIGLETTEKLQAKVVVKEEPIKAEPVAVVEEVAAEVVIPAVEEAVKPKKATKPAAEKKASTPKAAAKIRKKRP